MEWHLILWGGRGESARARVVVCVRETLMDAPMERRTDAGADLTAEPRAQSRTDSERKRRSCAEQRKRSGWKEGMRAVSERTAAHLDGEEDRRRAA